MNTIDLTPIFQALIALMGALVTYKLIPWIKSKTTAQQQENLQAAAKIAVYAAEQLYPGKKEGEKKLDYVINALDNAGFYINKPMAREAIEKAVYEINSAHCSPSGISSETENHETDETAEDEEDDDAP
ncbi:MAG: hypothetical protein IJ523_12275 [Succinivibrionaceae bacterium]|nr:hypothetical protein [Succinivibrionaceae bacterium]